MDAIVYDKVGKEAEKVREVLYGIYPQATITDAAIASFDDGADGIPVKALTVGIEPVQNLHGYDSQWPAGGGKNKLHVTAQTQTINGVTFTVYEDGTVNVNGTASETINFVVGTFPSQEGSFVLNGCPTGGSYTSGYSLILSPFTDQGSGIAVNGGEIATGNCSIRIVSGATVSNQLFKPMIRLATETDATFAPYSNICPINGWTGAEIEQTGVNVWDEEWEIGSIYDDNGLNNNSRTDVIRSKNYIPVKAGESYYYNVPQSYYFVYDSDKTFITIVYASEKTVITIPANGCYLRFRLYPSYGTTYNNDVSINYPASDTTYNPYTGNQISVTFPTEAGDSGTVYGGTLTLNPDRTGTLVVDKAMLTANGTESWTVNSNLISRCCNLVIPDMKLRSFLYCNLYDFVSTLPPVADRYGKIMTLYNSGLNQNVIGVGYNAGETVDLDGFKAFLSENPLQVVYELASPRTYQLTAEQVSSILETLYGTNNVWANTGNTEKLTYRADLGKYIDSHITTAVANALNA